MDRQSRKRSRSRDRSSRRPSRSRRKRVEHYEEKRKQRSSRSKERRSKSRSRYSSVRSRRSPETRSHRTSQRRESDEAQGTPQRRSTVEMDIVRTAKSNPNVFPEPLRNSTKFFSNSKERDVSELRELNINEKTAGPGHSRKDITSASPGEMYTNTASLEKVSLLTHDKETRSTKMTTNNLSHIDITVQETSEHSDLENSQVPFSKGTVVETGDEPATCSGRRTLVLANHQSTGDVPMLMAAWNPRPGVLSNLMWIMDRIFKFTNFGIVSVLHEDFFIQAGKSKREQSLEDLKIHIHKSYIPLGRQLMVLFPEGGFLHKRREISHRFAEKNNLPKLEYVSLPRAGAMKIIMEEIGPFRNSGASSSRQARRDNDFNQNNEKMILDTNSGDHIEWILDVTIAYPERVPLHLYDIVCGIRPPCTTHLHYRLYPADEVPSDTEGMTQWLYDRFIEKDKMLEEFYRTGQFPCKEGICQHERIVRQDNLRYLILHLFFILSTVIQFKLFYYLIRTFIW